VNISKRPAAQTLPRSLWKRIYELNALDAELYEHAKDREASQQQVILDGFLRNKPLPWQEWATVPHTQRLRTFDYQSAPRIDAALDVGLIRGVASSHFGLGSVTLFIQCMEKGSVVYWNGAKMECHCIPHRAGGLVSVRRVHQFRLPSPSIAFADVGNRCRDKSERDVFDE
jgi:hypothetical protein